MFYILKIYRDGLFIAIVRNFMSSTMAGTVANILQPIDIEHGYKIYSTNITTFTFVTLLNNSITQYLNILSFA